MLRILVPGDFIRFLRVLDDISFTAPDLDEKNIKIDQDYVSNHIEDLANNADLSKFIL